jgi:hypothetical protein
MAITNASRLASYVGAAITADGASGIVTAQSFHGDGANLTNVGVDTAQVSTSGLVVSGISTLSNVAVSGASTVSSSFDITGTTRIGPSNQISISHNTSNGNITCDTGYQYIRGESGFRVQKEGTGFDDIIKADADGAVELYYDDVKKFETDAGGVKITGVCTATSFSGSVAASQLTGALPAIDGSALTGVSAGLAASTITLQTWLFGGG